MLRAIRAVSQAPASTSRGTEGPGLSVFRCLPSAVKAKVAYNVASGDLAHSLPTSRLEARPVFDNGSSPCINYAYL